MEKITILFKKKEILEGLMRSFDEVSQVVESLDDTKFTAHESDKWSVAENFQHLILSNIPIASGLKMPKMAFRIYGTTINGSRSYEELFQRYKEVLAGGQTATVRYSPEKGIEFNKEEMLVNWKTIKAKFSKRLEYWSENDLDKFRAPHPALGKITIREMMFFTIFHNYHHLAAIKNQIAGK